MLPKFIHSILLLSSLANSLRASPTSHSISDPFKPKSSSYPSALLEKRGRPAASRSSSSSSIDSEATIPPDAPVLKATTNDEGGNQGQKRKRVRSEEQRLNYNEYKRKAYARKKKDEKHVAISGGKQSQTIKIVLSDAQRLRRNENSRKRYARQSVEQIAVRKSLQKTNRRNKSAEQKIKCNRAISDARARKWNELEGNDGGAGVIDEEGKNEINENEFDEIEKSGGITESEMIDEEESENEDNLNKMIEEMFEGYAESEMIEGEKSENKDNLDKMIEEMFEGFDLEEEGNNEMSDTEFNEMMGGMFEGDNESEAGTKE
jgi:hypothetical protein